MSWEYKTNKQIIIFTLIFAILISIVMSALIYNQNMDDKKCPDPGYVYHSFFSLGEKCVFYVDQYNINIVTEGKEKIKEVN